MAFRPGWWLNGRMWDSLLAASEWGLTRLLRKPRRAKKPVEFAHRRFYPELETLERRDVPNSAPVFTSASYATTLYNHSPYGQAVISVSASDPSNPSGDPITSYSLVCLPSRNICHFSSLIG
jgi:hypothetical protein